MEGDPLSRNLIFKFKNKRKNTFIPFVLQYVSLEFIKCN